MNFSMLWLKHTTKQKNKNILNFVRKDSNLYSTTNIPDIVVKLINLLNLF